MAVMALLQLLLLCCSGVVFAQPEGRAVLPAGTAVQDFGQLTAALSDPSVEVILLPERLEPGEADRLAPPVEVGHRVVLMPHPAVDEATWDQKGLRGLISVQPGGDISVQGTVNFVGCVPLASEGECRLSASLPGVFATAGGTVRLSSTRLVCTEKDTLVSDPFSLVEQFPVLELNEVSLQKVLVGSFSGCGMNGTEDGSSWGLEGVTVAWDRPGCYERGVLAATGSELQKALANPKVGNVYLLASFEMSDSEWPKSTDIYRQVNVTGCGGVVWDTKFLPQKVFVWDNGDLRIYGHGNMTLANSKPSTRRGNVWLLIGAFSAETGNITLENLTVTGSEQTPFHPMRVGLNPTRNWPFNCCDNGNLVHNGIKSYHMNWTFNKAEWVKASAGMVIPDNAFWQFNDIIAEVKVPDPCFEDYGVQVANSKQLFDSLNDPELFHIQVMGSIDLHDWDSRAVVSRPGVIVRACSPTRGERYALTIPFNMHVIDVRGPAASLLFEGDLELLFQPSVGDLSGHIHRPIVVDDGALFRLEDGYVDCSLTETCVVPESFLTCQNCTTLSNGAVFVRYAEVAVVEGGEPEGHNVNGTWALVNTTVLPYMLATAPPPVPPPSSGISTAALLGLSVGLVCLIILLAVISLKVMRTRKRQDSEDDKLAARSNSDFDSLPSSSIDVEGGHSMPGIMKKIVAGQLAAGAHTCSGDKVQILELLGVGGQAKVYRANWKGVIVAYKVIQLPPDTSKLEQHQAQMTMETAISATLRHPNVVQTFSYDIKPMTHQPDSSMSRKTSGEVVSATSASGGKDRTSDMDKRTSHSIDQEEGISSAVMLYEMSIIQEYCNKGSLYHALSHGNLPGQIGRRTEPDLGGCIQIANDVACGMHHMHSMQIIHGDLKAQNVLLTSLERDYPPNIMGKVCDFGMSVLMDSGQSHVSNVHQGTITHMDPETLLSGKLTKKSDVYAFGILLYELFSGRKAFEGESAIAISQAVTHKNKRPTFPPTVPIGVVELACQCWHKSPDERPTFEEVMKRLGELKQMHISGHLIHRRPGVQSEACLSDMVSSSDGGDDGYLLMKQLQMQGGSTPASVTFASNVQSSTSPSSSSVSNDNVLRRPQSEPTKVLQARLKDQVGSGNSDDEDEDEDSEYLDEESDEESDEEDNGNTVLLTSAFMREITKSVPTDAASHGRATGGPSPAEGVTKSRAATAPAAKGGAVPTGGQQADSP